MWLSQPLRPSLLLGLTLAFVAPTQAQALDVYTAQSQVLPKERYLDAIVEPVHQATVSAQTSGRIKAIHFDVDDYVTKGDVLIEFRDKPQRAAFNAAQANYKEARADYTRTKDIYAQKLVAKAVLGKAEARLKSAKAKFEQAQESLEHTVVRAPYSGIMVKRHIEVGENANVGQKLMTGLSLELLRAKVSIPQDMLHQVRAHRQASLVLPDQRRIKAESLRISPFADEATHTFAVQVYLPKGDYDIYPGMFTKVSFVIGEQRRLLIPEVAVVRRSEVSAVYILNQEDRLSFRQVRLGRKTEDGQIEVLAGLQPGERVAADPIRASVLLKQQYSGR